MKKILFTLFIFIFFMLNINALELNSQYAILYNPNENKIMYEKNKDDEIKVASMTKIMTAILVIENNKDLDKLITIKDEDLRDMYEYTTVGFQEGQEVTIKELLYGILLKSGADAVDAAVRVTSGDEKSFVKLMNEKVHELGLKHTNFSNPVGRDLDNYSSVYDIAMIMNYCLKNDTFKEIVSTDMYYIDRLNIQINGPLYKMDEKYDMDLSIIKGSKSGYTSLAKHSLVSYSEKDEISYIAVVDYSDKYKDVLIDTSKLYNYFFDNYEYVNYDINFRLPVDNGSIKEYKVDLTAKLLLNKDYNKDLLTYKYDGVNNISILNKFNNKLGNVSIYYDGKLLKKIPVKLDKKITYKHEKGISIFLILGIIIFLVIIIRLIAKKRKKIKAVNTQNKEIPPKVEMFIKEENSIERKLDILTTTYSVNLFFNTLKNSNISNKEKEKYEKDFIDRSFYNIDFTKKEELKDLFVKLKLYINEMQPKTVEYCDTLFKYCYNKYINKKG